MDAAQKWADKELELVQRHEQVLKQREALLRTTECYFNVKTSQPDTFVTDIHTASARNKRLLDEMRDSLNGLRSCNKPSNKLDMLKRVFPVWSEECNEYERRKNRSEYSNTSIDAAKTPATSNSLSVPRMVHHQVTQHKPQSVNSTLEGTLKSTNSATLATQAKFNNTAGSNKSTGKQPAKSAIKNQSKSSMAAVQSPQSTVERQSMVAERSRSTSSTRLIESDNAKEKIKSRRAHSEQRLV